LTKNATIDPEHPCWEGYREFLRVLENATIPSANSLTQLLPEGTVNEAGRPVRFVPASGLDVRDYEKYIYQTGEVSTRENNWHDFFNALAWCRFPRLKAAMNARHYGELDKGKRGRRGQVRDALTLLDESGVIVTGLEPDLLEALAGRDWHSAFVTHRNQWGSNVRVTVCGHAILEKFLKPYKSLTAHALLLHTPEMLPIGVLDQRLAGAIMNGEVLESTVSLSPLPLAGIPGWWRTGAQDEVFYQDSGVFRPDSGRRPAAPVHKLSAD
jgi:hypothetical protein